MTRSGTWAKRRAGPSLSHEKRKEFLRLAAAMSRHAYLAALLCFLLLPLAAGGQSSGSSAASSTPVLVQVLEDPPGDVKASAGGQGAANPSPRAAQLDILGATVLESPLEIAFTLQLAATEDPTEPPLAESGFYLLHFIQNDVEYAVQYGRIKSQETGVWGLISRFDPASEQYYAIDFVPVVVDAAQKSVTATVRRDLIVDSQGAKPYPGTSLQGFWAESQAFMEIFLSPVGFTGEQPPTIRDRVPEAGTSAAAVPILLGPKQVGSARIASPMPTRQSNGEAGTFVYTVTCRNIGQAEEQYKASIATVPSGWDVTIPTDLFAVKPGEELSFAVVVRTPFTHRHGTFESLMLRVEELDDPAARAEVELGIRYPKVPQPAGHHNQLWLHGAPFTDDPTVPVYALAFGFNIEYAWMNALMEDGGDRRVPVPSDPTTTGEPKVPGEFRWSVPLAPELSIGLDFDTTQTGTFGGSFSTTAPVLGASLSGELVRYVDSRFDQFGFRVGGNRTVLATGDATAPQDITSGNTVAYTLPLTPTAASDLVPLEANSAMVLELKLTGNRPDTPLARDPPKLMPGATVVLPLVEYHDPVDSVFAATPKLVLQTAAQDRQVNPGRTMVFNVAAQLAPDAGAHTLRAGVTGAGAEHARLLGEPERAVEAGTSWGFAVGVAIPADAKPGDVVDLVVRVQAVDDPSLQALVRLYGTVTTETDVPDEAELAASKENVGTARSPGPALGTLLALLVVATGLRRRA